MTMTPDEAIKELLDNSAPPELKDTTKHRQAELLGIEALRLIKKNREGGRVIVYKPLPGETEE